MSTRHVWESYKTEYEIVNTSDKRNIRVYEADEEFEYYDFKYYTKASVSSNGAISLSNEATIRIGYNGGYYDEVGSNHSIQRYLPSNCYIYYSGNPYRATPGGFSQPCLTAESYSSTSWEGRRHNRVVFNSGIRITAELTKGRRQGYVSSATDGQYPQDGVSGSSWYDYQGQDNIDASAVSIPSTIMGGTQITITVTPGTGKVYAGTVSYIYQVKLGSGAWTTIATTTATTRTYTVPHGTESIQVRVQAKDDIGFTSSDYATSSAVTVINNQPPTAPGSIQVTNVVKGQTATITITAATDPDGTVASYIYERSVDGSAWTQIANANSLTQTDQVSADWGTVAYRACAVDDDGASGPYVTSETTTVNSGWIIISGPAADMGDKPAPFDFTFTPNVTGQTGVTDISVVVTLDGEEIYNDTPDAGQEVSLPIDTRLMRAGEHTIQVAATKTDFLEANASYEFNIPAITLPDGGKAEQLQNPEGDVIFPYTLARLVIGKDGKDLNELLEGLLKSAANIQVGTYTGTGTYGAANPNTLVFDFIPKLVIITGIVSAGSTTRSTAIILPGFGVGQSFNQSGTSIYFVSFPVTLSEKTLSWSYNASTFYGEGVNISSLNSAIQQLNGAAATYNYIAIGQ